MNCVPSGRAYQKPPPRPPSCLSLVVAVWSIIQLVVGLGLVGCGVYGMATPESLEPYQDLWMEVMVCDWRVVVVAGGALLSLLSLLSLAGVMSARKQLLEASYLLYYVACC